MEPSLPGLPLPTVSPDERKVVARFAEALARREADGVSDFLSADERKKASPALLTALACLEIERRWSRLGERSDDPDATCDFGGQASTVRRMIQALPQLADSADHVVALIAADYSARRRCGQEVNARAYQEQFPDLADAIHARLAEVDPYATIAANDASSQKDAGDTVSLARTFDLGTEKGEGAERRPVAGGALRRREFGDYVLEEEIARGGMGVVYKAVQRKLNRTVAVKMILSGHLASEQEVRRFYTEAEAAAHLDHPGIVPIYEVNEIDGQHFFSMGYVDGQSLAERLKNGPLPPREAAEIVRQAAEAVAYAHAHGVIHRDLKPANILMTQEGRPRVTDFGLAKTVEGDSGLTASGQILGTPNYMPPEQALGNVHEVGPLSDVYSLGAVLYCLLTGRPPFQAATAIETLRQVIEREPVSPRLLNPAVDADLETICRKCLEKNPEHRIESATELADELDRYLRGEPIRSRPVGLATRGVRWLKRNRTTAALVALAPIVLIAVASAVVFGHRAAESRRLTQWSNAVQAGLEHVELTAEHMTTVEGLIARIEQRAPEDAAEFRRRLLQAWAATVEQAIARPRLTLQDVEQIEGALAILAERNSDQVELLTSLLERRKSRRQPAFELTAPFAELPAVFGPATVESRGGALHLVRPSSSQPASPDAATAPPSLPATIVVPTQIDSGTRVQLVGEFDEGWDAGHEVGLSLSHSKHAGYSFVLRPAAPAATDEEGPIVASAPDGALRVTFAQARLRGGSAAVEIRRNGSLVQRHDLPLSDIPAGPLRLRAAREAGELTFQVNSQEPIEFYDPFPIGAARAGVFAVHWPESAGVTLLKAEEELRGEAVTAIEQADALFEEERFDEALARYSEAALTSGPELHQEIDFKRGLCLMRLNRTDEAAQAFQILLAQPGDRWPLQAGVQLWLAMLQQKRYDDANAVYELLEARAELRQLALMAPADVRQEILRVYLQELGSYSNSLSFHPDRLRNLERAAAIDRLLSYNGLGDPATQFQLARGYQFVGDYDAALKVLEPITASEEMARSHYLRILRHVGRSDEALQRWHDWSAPIDEATSSRLRRFTDLLFIHLARSEWDAAEAVIGEGFAAMKELPPDTDPDTLTYLQLIAGILRAERGDEAGAMALWRNGYRQGRPLLAVDRTASATVNVLIMGSFCGELTDDEAWRFVQKASGGGGGGPFALALQLVNRASVGEAFRRMWTTPRGRQVARDFAFDAIPMRERIERPALLAGYQYLADAAFGGNLAPEQDDALWRTVEDGFAAAVKEGRLNGAQFMQLGLTWKGTTSLLGWQGVAPALDPSLRASLAYVLAHRYVRLGNLPQAERFLQVVLKDAAPDSPLVRLAEDDLHLLRAGQAPTPTAPSSAPGQP